MKDKVISAIQKIILVFLAALMILCVLPVGLFRKPSSSDTKGEFIKLLPVSVSADVKNDRFKTAAVGKGAAAHMEFDISRLSDTDVKDIKEVKLRLAFIKGSGMPYNSVSVSAVGAETDLDDTKGIAAVNFYRTGNKIHPQTADGENSLSEIDLTEYVRARLKKKAKDIRLAVVGSNRIAVHMADLGYGDPSCVPYLKIITGKASAEDLPTLQKNELADAVFTSADAPDDTGAKLAGGAGGMLCGASNEAYIRFNLNRAVIEGTLYKARLALKTDGEGGGYVRIYCLNNNQWTGDTISYKNSPRGEEAQTFADSAVKDTMYADVTQAVCDAAAQGQDSITFKITARSADTSVKFYGRGDAINEPKLYMNTTDDSDIACAAEAALNALGDNAQSYVTTDLTNTYSESGSFAKITWQEYDMNGKRRTGSHLTQSGRIIRPKWFEGNADIIAHARIKSGDYVTERKYRISVQAAAEPDYSKYTFGNYVDIGNGKSEDEQRFDCVNTSDTRRTGGIFGSRHTWRVPMQGGSMLLNLACASRDINYLTLKLSSADKNTTVFSVMPCGYSGQPLRLEIPDFRQTDDGFIYMTYALPGDFTAGRAQVSLRLMSESGGAREEASRRVYAAYMTQSPYFDPSQFIKQGEAAPDEAHTDSEYENEFLHNAYEFLKESGIENAAEKSIVPGLQTAETAMVSDDGRAVIFGGAEANIAFKLNDNMSADIYERRACYDSVSRGVPMIEGGGVLAADFGSLLMMYNRTDRECAAVLPEESEIRGIYKETLSGGYYKSEEEYNKEEYPEIPENTDINDFGGLIIPPGSAVLLKRVDTETRSADWRITMVNGKSASEFSFDDGEVIGEITLKAVGGVARDTSEVCVICGIYRKGRLIDMKRETISVSESRSIYAVDMSKYNMYLGEGRSLRIFAADETDRLNTIQPKLEYPR